MPTRVARGLTAGIEIPWWTYNKGKSFGLSGDEIDGFMSLKDIGSQLVIVNFISGHIYYATTSYDERISQTLSDISNVDFAIDKTLPASGCAIL